MTWVLYVCFNITWAGCSVVHYTEYPTEESCYRALDRMVKPKDKDEAVAYCMPMQPRLKGATK